MNDQESKIISSVTFFFLVAIAGFLIFLSKTDLCWSSNCSNSYAGNIAYPMLYAFTPVFIASLINFFTSSKAYFFWKILSIIYIPVFAILAFLAPLECGIESCYDKNEVAKISGIVFFIVSLAIAFLMRGKSDTETDE